MDWFLYDNGLRHERVNGINFFVDLYLRNQLYSISDELNFENLY